MTDHLNASAQTVAQHAGEAAWRAVRAYAAANPLIPPWMMDVIESAKDAAVSAAVQSVTINAGGVTVTDERTIVPLQSSSMVLQTSVTPNTRKRTPGESPAAWPRITAEELAKRQKATDERTR